MKAVNEDDIIEVYFYKQMEDGWHIYDTFHMIEIYDIVQKINGSQCVQESRRRWAHRFFGSIAQKVNFNVFIPHEWFLDVGTWMDWNDVYLIHSKIWFHRILND